jgi:hypothetical protein
METQAKKYAGVKVVEAQPMTVKEAEKILGHKIDMSKHPGEKNGYLVTYPDGYQSFSPKSVFEEAYEEIEGRALVSFPCELQNITSQMLTTEFDNWRYAMSKKYSVTIPDFRVSK